MRVWLTRRETGVKYPDVKEKSVTPWDCFGCTNRSLSKPESEKKKGSKGGMKNEQKRNSIACTDKIRKTKLLKKTQMLSTSKEYKRWKEKGIYKIARRK